MSIFECISIFIMWHEKIHHIEFELSSHCNARCPQCPREAVRNNPNWYPRSLDLDFFQNRIGTDIFQKLGKVIFCGTYGDPSMARDALEICKFVRNANPKILIDFHTNGGTRSTDWWKELASVIGTNGKVVWGFDGLADTNHLYRIGVNWEKAWANAMAYIAANGNAEWQYIIFKHNQHQVQIAKELAYSTGFTDFIEIVSTRFHKDLLLTNEMRTFIPEENRYLEPANILSKDKIFDIVSKNNTKTMFDLFDQITNIDCESKKIKKLYVTVDGYLLPCEHLVPTINYKINKFITGENFPKFDEKYPLSLVDLKNVSITEALSSEWFKGLTNTWNLKTCTGRINTCVRNCGIKN